MFNKSIACATVLFASVAAAGTASAAMVPIPVVPVWATADEFGVLNNFYSDTWVATHNGTVLVTDYAVVGDNYNIYRNGVLVASTNVPDWSVSDPGNTHFTLDPNVAWADPLFAHASFFANTGDLITIYATSVPSGYSDGTVAVSSVPEPATWATLLLGFGVMGFAGYRSARKRAEAVA